MVFLGRRGHAPRLDRYDGRSLARVVTWIRRRVPAWLALPATILLVVAFVGLVGGQMVVRGFVGPRRHLRGAGPGDRSGHRPADARDRLGQPSIAHRWETMGRWGRDFAAGVTSRDRLLAYHGADAKVRDPVQVIAGMRLPADRGASGSRGARAGACGRLRAEASSPSGCPAGRDGWTRTRLGRSSGCMPATRRSSPSSTRTCRASSASSSTAARPSTAGAVLFEAVHQRWSALPEQDRPRLVVFGASLGPAGRRARSSVRTPPRRSRTSRAGPMGPSSSEASDGTRSSAR